MTTTSATPSTGTGAILQSLGVGSGLDINSIVTQLVAADTSSQTSQIARETQQTGTQITAMGQLKGALGSFQTALNSLNQPSDYQTLSALSSDNTLFSATAGPTAAAGIYNVEVKQLAQGQQILSKPFAGASSNPTMGTGSLTLSLGSSSFTVQIDTTNNTLSGIVTAINTAGGNPGISASIVQGTQGAQLVLSSNQTGAANTISVSDNSSNGLDRLAYSASAGTNYTSLQTAQDAKIIIAGVEVDSATNVVNNAVSGVTVNLVAAKPGTTNQLTVANNPSQVTTNVQSFVSAYNSLQTVLNSLDSYDASSKTAGPLLGDPILTGLVTQLRGALNSPVTGLSGNYTSLSSVGISTASDGSLSLDQSKLTAALNANFAAVGAIFGSKNGVASGLTTVVNAALSDTGGIAQRNNTLTQQQQNIANQQTALNALTQTLTNRYEAQFTAMDALLSQMQHTSTFLTQQLQTAQSQTLSNSLT